MSQLTLEFGEKRTSQFPSTMLHMVPFPICDGEERLRRLNATAGWATDCGPAWRPPMQLYHCRDTRSLRPLWALEEAGLAYELEKMPFPPRYCVEGYLDINPLGTVPALRIGDAVMTESAAMCQLIGELAEDASMRLGPAEPDYPLYLNWLHRSDTTLTFPLTLVLRYSRLEPEERRSAQVTGDYRLWFLKRAQSVERALEGAEHLCGGRFTMADIAVGYALYLADRLGISGDFEPRTRDYLARLTARPAFLRASELQSDMALVV